MYCLIALMWSSVLHLRFTHPFVLYGPQYYPKQNDNECMVVEHGSMDNVIMADEHM